MWLFDFIFLARNWAQDERNFMNHMKNLSSNFDPLWLLLYPEGTTLTFETRKKSVKFAEKNNLEPFRHVLIPRTLGLYKCFISLKDSVEYVYDFTIGVPGVKLGQSPQYIYTLALMYVIGLNPQQLHIYIRRFRTSDIPEDEEGFEQWLRLRWREKDDLLEHFYSKGCFPADFEHLPSILNLSLRHFFELLQIPLLAIPWFILAYLLKWYYWN